MSRTLLLPLICAVAWAGEGPAPAPHTALTVATVAPQLESWPVLVRADGDIAAWQEAVVTSETGGLRLIAVLAAVGDRVRAGQVLAELDTAVVRAELAAQEAALAEARAGLETASADARRAEELRASGTLTAQQTAQYLASERSATARVAAAQARLEVQRLALERSRVVAPDDGMVTACNAVLGQVVPAGAELFRLIRQERLEWRAEVVADDLARVRPGQAATLALPGAGSATGAVRAVAPALSARTRTATVYVDLPTSAARAGMFASGTIEAGDPRPALTVPAAAVVMRDGRSLVFAVIDGTARERRVVTGRRQGERIEITAGLAAEARVVTAGGAFLSDGDPVAVAP